MENLSKGGPSVAHESHEYMQATPLSASSPDYIWVDDGKTLATATEVWRGSLLRGLGFTTRARYRCRCRCACCSTPGSRRVECTYCGCFVCPGICVAVENEIVDLYSDKTVNVCHVCNDSGVESRCEGAYAHWSFGDMWEAYICYVVLLVLWMNTEEGMRGDSEWDIV